MQLQEPERTDDAVGWLQRQPWWQDLPCEDLERLASAGERRTVPEGQLLMVTGRPDEEILLIIAGEVSVSRGGSVIAWLGPGDTVGELAVLDHVPRQVEVHATSPVELLALDTDRVDETLAEIQPMRTRVMEAAARHPG